MRELSGEYPPALLQDREALREQLGKAGALSSPEERRNFARGERMLREFLERWGDYPGGEEWQKYLAGIRGFAREYEENVACLMGADLYPVLMAARRGRPPKKGQARRPGAVFEKAWGKFAEIWEERATEELRRRVLECDRKEFEAWRRRILVSMLPGSFDSPEGDGGSSEGMG